MHSLATSGATFILVLPVHLCCLVLFMLWVRVLPLSLTILQRLMVLWHTGLMGWVMEVVAPSLSIIKCRVEKKKRLLIKILHYQLTLFL